MEATHTTSVKGSATHLGIHRQLCLPKPVFYCLMFTPLPHFDHWSLSIAHPPQNTPLTTPHSNLHSYLIDLLPFYSYNSSVTCSSSPPPPTSSHCPILLTNNYHANSTLVDFMKWCDPIITSPLTISILNPVILTSFSFSTYLRMRSKGYPETLYLSYNINLKSYNTFV